MSVPILKFSHLKLPTYSKFVLISNIILFASSTYGWVKETEEAEKISENLAKGLNAFSNCIIRVLNFQGLNFNATPLTEPILLLRYYNKVLSKGWYLIPYEVESSNMTAISNFLKTPTLDNNLYSSLKPRFIFDSRGCTCEAIIHLFPPARRVDQSLYWDRPEYGFFFIKDPISLAVIDFYSQHQWKTFHINGVKQYCLLIISRFETIEILHAWRFTAWSNPQLVGIPPVMLVWLTDHNEYYIDCKHCSKCDPYNGAKMEALATTKRQLDQYEKIRNTMSVGPPLIHNFIPGAIPMNVRSTNYARVQKNVLYEYSKLDMHNVATTQGILDIHIIAIILPKNSTVEFESKGAEDFHKWRNIEITGCPLYKSLITFHPVSRPGFWRHTGVHLAQFPIPSLAFRREALRFVSCHKQEVSWINNLKKLVVSVDIYTWFILTSVIGLVSITISKLDTIYSKIQNRKTQDRCQIYQVDVGFQVFSLLLEQGSRVFHSSIAINTRLALCIFFSLPITMSILSNEYKGDNITKLTVPEALIPFDTFDIIQKNKFNIFTLPIVLSKWDQTLVPESMQNRRHYQQENGHEAFPVVSQIWFYLNLANANKWKDLGTMLKEFPTRIGLYLNNTKLFPNWPTKKTDSDDNYAYEDFVTPHLEKCDKSAVILDENTALVVHTNFSKKGAPVFFGKDVLYENFRGYHLFGHFSESIFRRIQNLAGSGILEWWRKYADVRIVKMTHTENIEHDADEGHRASKGGEHILILGIIPCIGLLGSLLIFVVYDGGIKILWLSGSGFACMLAGNNKKVNVFVLNR